MESLFFVGGHFNSMCSYCVLKKLLTMKNKYICVLYFLDYKKISGITYQLLHYYYRGPVNFFLVPTRKIL